MRRSGFACCASTGTRPDGWLWELPAGKLEPDEPPLETARRELIEEAGVRASHWESLGATSALPACSARCCTCYLATGLETAAAAPEPSEVFEVHWKPFGEACGWALDGAILDGKTALGCCAPGIARSRPRLRPGPHDP